MSNKYSIKTIGSTALAKDKERSKLDYYGTDPRSTKSLLDNEVFCDKIWEPCVGHHLISDILIERGKRVRTSDIVEYEGYNHEILDFLDSNETWDGDIITNPPYNISSEIIAKALDTVNNGRKVAAFLRLPWLEGQARYNKIFKINPPKTVYIFVNRQVSSKVDDFSGGSAVAYCWIVWEKGYKGDPSIKWIQN